MSHRKLLCTYSRVIKIKILRIYENLLLHELFFVKRKQRNFFQPNEKKKINEESYFGGREWNFNYINERKKICFKKMRD